MAVVEKKNIIYFLFILYLPLCLIQILEVAKKMNTLI